MKAGVSMQLEDYFDFFEDPYAIRIKGRHIGLENIIERHKDGQSPEQIAEVTAPHGSSRGLLWVCTDALPPQSNYVGFVQHRRGGMRCPSVQNEHHVQDTLMLFPKGTTDRGTPKQHAIGKVLPDRIARSLRSGKGPFIPMPEGRGLLAP